MIDSTSDCWFFLFWTFHIWYKKMRKWVTLATYFCHSFFSLLQSSCYNFFVYFRNFFYTTITQMSSVKRNEKITCGNCGTQTRRSVFWQCTRCSTGTLHFTQCPNFTTTSQTYLAFLRWFSQLTVETWRHFSLTTFSWFWTINRSRRLEITLLQVTSYRAPFRQSSP